MQRVLDTAFAWSGINSHLEVADFLLKHGADINTTWSSLRAGEHPARAGLSCELRVDGVSDRPWYRHDHQGLSLERHGTRGVPRGEGREDGAVAGGRGAATGTAALSDRKAGEPLRYFVGTRAFSSSNQLSTTLSSRTSGCTALSTNRNRLPSGNTA